MSLSKIETVDKSGNRILVNFESLGTFSSKIVEESEVLKGIATELLLLTEDMDKFFNTPTANKMQEALILFLKETQTKCDKLNNVGQYVDKSKKAYENARDRARKSMGA